MTKHILLVDDDPMLRRSLAFNLERAGYRVNTAASAEDALALAHHDPPNLVLLDIGLPGMDGLEALHHFRTRGEVPIIFLTGRRRELDEILGLELGADGSGPARLTDNPADDFAPARSPDGTQIASVSDRDWEAGIYELLIMDVVSTAVTRLTDDKAIDYSPTWSPDGTRIAFRSHHDGPGDIYVINVDGTGLTNLTNNPADDWAPAWSPDGTQIALQTNRDGNWEVYV